MTRSRTGLLLSAVVLVLVGSLPAVATAQPTPTPAPTTSGRAHEGWLSGVLHGEGIVQTKKGPIRVAMQNGTASTVTATSVTVRSTDGYTRTWTLGDNLKVYDKRHTLQPGALKAGADLAIAGQVMGQGNGLPPASPGAGTYTAHVVFVRSA